MGITSRVGVEWRSDVKHVRSTYKTWVYCVIWGAGDASRVRVWALGITTLVGVEWRSDVENIRST